MCVCVCACVRVCVTETPAGISAAPLRYRHIPLLGEPVSAYGRDACLLHKRVRVCSARRGCHSCDGMCVCACMRVCACVCVCA